MSKGLTHGILITERAQLDDFTGHIVIVMFEQVFPGHFRQRYYEGSPGRMRTLDPEEYEPDSGNGFDMDSIWIIATVRDHMHMAVVKADQVASQPVTDLSRLPKGSVIKESFDEWGELWVNMSGEWWDLRDFAGDSGFWARRDADLPSNLRLLWLPPTDGDWDDA